MTLMLSVLDLSPIGSGSTATAALHNTLELARLADRLGYTRYWLAEHHNMPAIASSSPEIMIGLVARETKRIRVGSGGIMLPNHAPLKVAEAFRTLEALFPGRIDLGLGRAPGTDPVTARALRGARGGAEDFPAQLEQLFAFTTGEFPAGHPFQRITAVPNDVPLPPVWLLGSSDYSAHLAGAKGLPFGFASHFSPHDPVIAVSAYRQNFRPSQYLSEPKVMVAASVLCAETAEEAEYLAATVDLFWVRFRRGELAPLPSPEEALAYPFTAEERSFAQANRSMHIIGDPSMVARKLHDLAARTGADEVMITSSIHAHEKRLRSYELIAQTILQ